MTALPKVVPAPAARSAADLVVARFRLLAWRRAAWLRRLRSEEGTSAGLGAALNGELDAILTGVDSADAEVEWTRAQPWFGDWAAELHSVEEDLSRDTTSQLARFRQIFALSAEEADLFEACLAVAIEPSLRRLCAYLQDDAARTYMTEELAARLYGNRRGGVWNPESALSRWELLLSRDAGVGQPEALTCDAQIRDWVTGRQALPEGLAGIVNLLEPQAALPSWPVATTVDFIRRHTQQENRARLRITVAGARGGGRRTFATVVAAELGLLALAIDTDQIDEAQWRDVYRLAQRHAYLERCALVWCGQNAVQRLWPNVVPPFPLQFVIVEPGEVPHPCPGVFEHRIEMPRLTTEERAAMWRRYVPASRLWPEEEAKALAERYRVHVGDIASAAASDVASAQEAGLRVREATRGRLANLAQLLECPFTCDDLVIPPRLRAALEDIVFEANHRVAFWERSEPRRLFPQGQGLMALLSGPPGTGKTMAAQVIAAALGYDLFRVDLAAVVSKWVGETSQNFERILSRAADMHAIILFDECDAVFAKRTSEVRDAQDKFANTDAAYLLQAVESYPGVALLATNQKGNMDPAFIRRLRYLLEFARPDAPLRLEIWRKVARGLAGADRAAALEAGLQMLADAIDATGAQIKYAVLGGVFAAWREGVTLEARHLLHGLERELAKEGRALSARDRERILAHAR